MHLKFLARGTGSAAVAAAYLLALKDAAGKARAAVEVLRGDPMLVAAIADGLPFKHRYTSGVMAWSPEDAPTQPEIERVIDEFEKTAWAGLDPDRYVWAVVLHRDDDGGVHVHLFAARCDLATGLSLNIAPPGWERTFDPLRDAFNYEHGWSRPDDPSRARSFRPAPHLAYQARLARRAGEDVEPDVRHEIGMHLLELVAAGRVKDRAGVVAVLEERGYDVPRQGDHYLTARDRETGERWRLKGALYERDFDRERFLREAPAPSADRERADGDDAPAAAAWKALEKAQHRRADYNRAYYGRGHRPGRDGVQAAGGDGEVERESGPAAGRSAGHDASLAAHLERELGDGAGAAGADAAEPARARRAAAGEGRGERSLASADALAEAAHAAGPDLSRALDEHVAVRERAVCATSMGEQWLAGAQQEVLVEEEDRRLTVGERTRALETVEGRLETDLSRREADLTATTSGPVLLQEAFGERREGDAPLSFSAWERGLEGVEQRVDEELRTQEEALRAIPPGKRYLSEAEQVRVAAAAGPPVPVERESMVRAVAQRVGEELDRLKEELVAIAGSENLAEAAGALGGDGRTLSLVERWSACERVKSGLEEELDREEAAVLADPAGEEFLRDARIEVLGGADREAAALGERARIVKTAAEAQQKWNEEKTARVEALGALPGGLNLYHAHLADLDPAWGVNGKTTTTRENIDAALVTAKSDAPRLERLRDVLSDEADAARYREELDRVAGQFNTSDLDRVLDTVERERAERETQEWEENRDALVEELRALPGGMDLYHAHQADLDPKWDRKRNDTTTRENIDAALVTAKSDAPRLERLRDVLSDEADAARYREELDRVAGQFNTSDLDRVLDTVERERAERETQEWEENRDALVEELRALPGGMDLYHAHQADLDPKWDRKRNDTTTRENIDAALVTAKSDAPRLERLRDVLSDKVAADRYREVLADSPGRFKTADLDRALVAGEEARAERETQQWEENRDALIEELRALPGGMDLYHAHLADLDPAWGVNGKNTTARENIDAALVTAKSDAPRLERLRDVLSDEADAARYREVLADSPGRFKTADLDRALVAGEEARAERETQQWEENRDALIEELRALPGGMDLYHAHLADLDPAWGVNGKNTTARENIDAALVTAKSDAPRLERLRGVLSDKVAADRYREVLADSPGRFKTADLDRALVAGEEARAERETQQWEENRDALIEELRALPGGMDLYHAHLADLDPAWGVNGKNTTARENIDAALVTAKSDAPRLERLRDVLSDEADAARYREELDRVTGQFNTSDLDRVLDTVERERAERETQEWEENRDALVEELRALPGGMDLYHAHQADLDPKWDRKRNDTTTRENIDAALVTAKSDAPRLERLRDVLSDEADAARYREVLADSPGQFKTADLDRALVAGELERDEREAAAAATAARQQRWNAFEAFPGAQDAARARFDRLEPDWRDKGEVSPQCIDQVLDAVEQWIPKSLAAREASRRKGPNFSDYDHAPRYNRLLERARRKVPGDSAPEGGLTPQQRAKVLDKVDQLDGIERVVACAQRTCKELLGREALPSHDTVRTALRTVADEARHADPRWKQIAEATASDPLDYPDPGPVGERAAIKQKCIAADREQAREEANTQHQEDLDAWNAFGRVKKAITRQPERQEPEDPAPPTQARIDEYRQETLIRRVVQKIRDVLDYFLDRELVPADRVAERAFKEQPREREPLQPEHDPGHYHGR